MLHYLLDEHVSPAIATQMAVHRPEIRVVALKDWHAGAYLGADDVTILTAAGAESLTLVTFDLRTIPPLLRAWTEQGVRHGGVVFIHRLTLRPSNMGGLRQALERLWDAHNTADWADRVVFLQP